MHSLLHAIQSINTESKIEERTLVITIHSNRYLGTQYRPTTTTTTTNNNNNNNYNCPTAIRNKFGPGFKRRQVVIKNVGLVCVQKNDTKQSGNIDCMCPLVTAVQCVKQKSQRIQSVGSLILSYSTCIFITCSNVSSVLWRL
jgi:hypothetical protein